ncbi:hypothetical protein HanIR_Chr15g0780691 [Helianthus annuus]|nr:hypothetical protein HanIR_Chr15g0780691 [Helianthus annuus]
MDSAAVLSHFRTTGIFTSTLSSLKRFSSHNTSHVALHIDLYFASAEDRETTLCFLLFHETNEPPRKMQKPVIDLRLSTHLAQSESANAVKWKVLPFVNRIPVPGAPLRYLNTLKAI